MRVILLIASLLMFMTIDSFAIGSSDRVLYFEQMDSKNDTVIDVLQNLDVTTTGYFKFPVGTTAQRVTGSTGFSRWNTDEACLELFDGTNWFCVGEGGGGGGGSAGINFVSDASFENSELNPDSTTAALESYELYSVDAELYSPFNLQYFQADWSSLSAADAYVRDSFARTGLDDKQGLFSIWIKATTVSDQNLELCLRVDDATYTNACDDAYLLTITSDDTWRKYEIPFVFGAASVQYEIFNESYTGALEINVDKIYIGTMPDGYIQSINNVDTDWISYNPSIVGVGTPTINFARYKRVGDSIAIEANFVTGTPTATEFQFPLPDGLTIDSTIDTITIKGTAFSKATTSGNFEFTLLATGGDTFLNVGIISAGRDGQTPLNGNNLYGTSATVSINSTLIPIAEWSTGRTEVVNQQTELTAATANELVARFDNNGSTVTEVSSNYSGWYDSITRNGLGVVTIDYTSLGLTSLPSYNCETIDLGGTNNYGCRVNGISTTSATFIFYNTANNRVDTEFTFTLEKTGTDVNKSISVVGKFANINDTPLSQFESKGNSGIALTANVTNITFTETRNNLNAWDGDEFTAPRNSMYIFTGNVRFTAASGANLFFYKDTGSGYAQDVILTENNATSFNLEFAKAIYLNKGDKVAIRSNTAATLNNSSTLHHLSITELPDLSAIVENLSNNPRTARSDQYSESEIKWGEWNGQQLYRRCFTLASNVTATGVVVATWDANLRPVNSQKFAASNWFIPIGVYSDEGTGIGIGYCQYNEVGTVTCNAGGGRTIYADTTACLDYTK